MPSGIRSIVFDVGETLIDETQWWAAQAELAGIPAFTLCGVLGALIARGEDHSNVWGLLGIDRPATVAGIDQGDLYPDALECLRAAREAGLLVGIAGNQPASTEVQLVSLGFEADFIASSARWGVAKPSPDFFRKIIEAAGTVPHQILYVGDRVDNDVLPARAAGLRTAFLRRGPWGFIQAEHPEANLADLRLHSLAQLTNALTQLKQ